MKVRMSPTPISAMRLRVWRAVGDPDADRFSTASVDQALHDAGVWMYNEMSIDVGEHATFEDITYPANTERLPLPYSAMSNPVIKVEDITNPLDPVLLNRQDFFSTHLTVSQSGTGYSYRSSLAWAMVGDDILLRPAPTEGKVLRIWSLESPVTFITGYDTSNNPEVADTTAPQPYMPHFEELMVLLAAKRLTRTDEETPIQTLADLDELKVQFKTFARRFRGTRRIRNRRNWI